MIQSTEDSFYNARRYSTCFLVKTVIDTAPTGKLYLTFYKIE